METPVTKVLRESWKNEINPIESFEKKNGVLSAQTLQYNIDNKNIHHSNLSSVPSETIMLHEPCIDDFFMNKEDGVGIVDNTEILEDWLLHIDCLLEKAEHEKGLEIDEGDISTLFVRKSTIFCTLGLFDSAKHFAQQALDIQETSIGYYRLAIAQYCLKEYDLALETLLVANDLDGQNHYIQFALQVVLARIRSRKDRPEIIDEEG